MGLRFYTWLSEIAMAAALLLWPMAPVAGQPAAPAPKTTPVAKAPKGWTPSRTPQGQPDLQGYWTNAGFTPLERPVALGTKEFYTESEAANIEKRRIQRESTQKRSTYDKVWQIEPWGNVSSLRTSLIFDPPDGRIPPLTAKGQQRVAAEAEAVRRGASF
jgi:hypothetical protein